MYPAWSPGSEYVAFQSDKEGSPDIWLVDSEGENPRPFVVHPAEEVWSAWSRDGRWFYFTSNRSNVFEVWVRPVGDGEARQVTFHIDPAFGLPESGLFTKFAVSDSELIVPLESRRGDVYIMERGR
jgi:Tol biopolymer transport system component